MAEARSEALVDIEAAHGLEQQLIQSAICSPVTARQMLMNRKSGD
jgi:hypothetical protein